MLEKAAAKLAVDEAVGFDNGAGHREALLEEARVKEA